MTDPWPIKVILRLPREVLNESDSKFHAKAECGTASINSINNASNLTISNLSFRTSDRKYRLQ